MRMIARIRSLVLTLVVLSLSAVSFAQIGISVNIGPPALPVYEQPPCPAEGYMWTPGYWAWDPDIGQYYWVPGTWVLAPEPGFLWTPPWWGWGPGGFLFHEGFWGLHVGFYGGIYYGFGYFGHGYDGGRWEGGHFFYNRTVNNVNITNIHNVYNSTVINNNTTINRVSYNGGNGGITARPTTEEEAAASERHLPPVAAQNEHLQAARSNPQLRASVNHGVPPIAATPKPGAFNDRQAVRARAAGAPNNPAGNRGQVPRPNENAEQAERNVPRPPAVHGEDLQPHPRPAPPNTGNPKVDQKYQQQQDKLYSKMDQEHQQLQQRQEQEHQQLERRNPTDAQRQQLEQRHQQQTEQMEQRHQQQIQRQQQKQSPPGRR
jgi:hypothetical protein